MNNKLYVLRHCKTFFNERNIVSGQMDCPLTDSFIDYSILNNGNSCKPYILICSPLSRSILTGKMLQTQSKLQMSTFTDSRILERNMGIFEGKKRSQLVKEYPDYFINGHFIYYMTPPGGESYQKFKYRVLSFASFIEGMLLECNVVICSHNQTLRMLTAIMSRKKYEDIPKFPNGIMKEILL